MNFLVNLFFPLLLIGAAMPGELFPVTLVQNPTLQATFTKCRVSQLASTAASRSKRRYRGV